MSTLCSASATTVLVVAVIAHAHGIHWEFLVRTVCNHAFLSACFAGTHTAGLRTHIYFWTFFGVVRAYTICWALRLVGPGLMAAIFLTNLGIRAEFNAIWTYAT